MIRCCSVRVLKSFSKGCTTRSTCTGSRSQRPPVFLTINPSKERYKYCRTTFKTTTGTAFHGIRGYRSSVTLWNSSSNDGEILYQQALQAMDEIQQIRKRKEDDRSAKMYQAWEQAKDATTKTSSKTQGIQVVKTLVKETRKEMDQQQQQQNDETKIHQRAMQLLEEAALQHHHPMALVQLGNMALDRAGSIELQSMPDQRRAEIDKAIEFFQKAGNAGSRVGWYNLGQLLWTGYPELPEKMEQDDNDISLSDKEEEQLLQPDLHEAMDAFGKAIDLGDYDAMYLVGVHRMTAGGRENIHSGLKLVKRAGEGGHGGALYYLALFYLNGEPIIGLDPCSEEEFMRSLDRAVDAGSVDAMFTRGHSYYHGTEGYPQNYQRALRDFLQATEQGHADSAVSAGAMLHAGIGVVKDQERAFELYQTAGELGSIEGWRNVVACYVTGEGVPQSLETARYISETMLKNDKNEIER